MVVQAKTGGQAGRQVAAGETLRVRVTAGSGPLGSGAFASGTPQSFWWRGAWRRVLAVESVAAVGVERRCRVATREGAFELALDATTGRWQMRRSPNWLARLAARWQNTPRYPLPVWRRRTGRRAARLAAARQSAPRVAPAAPSEAEEWATVPC